VILFHLVVLAMWSWPTATLENPFLRFLEPYLRSTGLAQTWRMFAWPRIVNFYVEYTITYRDGTERHLFLPWKDRPAGFWQQYRQSRFSFKWADAVGHFRYAPYQSIWRDAAKYLARIHATDPANPPVLVSLTCHWASIPPPQEGLGRPLPQPTFSKTYYRYQVAPEDFS